MAEPFSYKDLVVEEPEGSVSIKVPEPGIENEPLTISRLRDFLIENRGYDQAVVDSITTPNLPVPGGVNWDTFYKDLFQFIDDPEQVVVTAEVEKLVDQLRNEGIDLPPLDRNRLTTTLARFGAAGIEGLAESRSWWNRAKRELADQAAETFTGTMTNTTLGLALLDVFERFDRGVKLGLMPAKKRHEIENEILPVVTLGEGDFQRDFSTATTASLWLMAQKAWGRAEEAAGLYVATLGNEPLHTRLSAAKNLIQAGQERQEFVGGQVPSLIAGMGRPLSWQEVVERTWGTPERIDDYYTYMGDRGLYGDIALAGVAGGFAFLDIFASPANLIAVGATKLPAAGRLALKGTAKAAEITGDIARTTHRLDDAIDAVRNAQAHFDRLDHQVTRSVTQSIEATGRPTVPASLYRRWILSRRHLNNHKDFLEGFREPQIDEVMLRSAPRRSPKLLPAPADDPIALEMHKTRRHVLQDGPDNLRLWNDADMPALTQRQVLGPDDAEMSGDALNMIIRTGGLSVDDATIGPIAPEYYVTPAHGPLPTIPWRDPDAAADITKAERNFLRSITLGLPEKPGQPVYDLETSTTRMLKVAEDVIRRNLGVARSLGDKSKVRLYERHLELNRKAQTKVPRNKPTKPEGQYEDVWFPKDQPGIMSTPERFNRWLSVAGDRVVRSIYPGALRIGYWHSTMGRLHNQIREPQRFYEVWDPETWNMIRSQRLRYDQSTAAWDDMAVKVAERAGVVRSREKFNPLKHWAPYTIDRKKDELLFNLLNTRKGSTEFNELLKDQRYTPELVKAHDEIRRALDTAADSQGIKDSDRYLEGYILHFFDKAQFKDGARPLEYIGLPRNVELWARHLLERRGNEGYQKSAMAALELYGRSMHRKTILEPMYQDVIARGEALATKMNNPAIMTYVNDYVSTLRGRPTVIGHALDEWIGGALNHKGKILWNPNEVDRKLMGVTSALYAGILTGNPRYPFMQIATAIPTTSMRFGLYRTTKGLFQMATREGQALSKAMGVYQPFLDIFESPAWQRAARLATETVPTVTPFGVMTNAAAERMIRGMTAHAAIDMYLTKFGFATWDEAVEAGWGRTIAYHALRASEEVNHMFGAHGRSPFLLRKLGGSQGFTVAATQFLSFNWKQTDELLSNLGRGGLEGLGRLGEYFAVSGWVSHIAAQHLGIDATTYVGLGYLPQEPDELTSPAVDLFLKSIDHAAAYAAQDPERIQRATRELLDSVENLAPLMGGFETASRGAKRLLTQEIRTTREEKLRPMDFAQTMPENFQETSLSDLARSIRPDEGPFGGELIPTLTGQQNIKEQLYRRGIQAARAEDKRFYYNARAAVDAYIDAADRGDVAAEQRLAEKLQNVYKIRWRGDTMIRRTKEARSVSKALRMIDPKLGGDKKLFDRYMKIFREHGINLE